MPLLPVVDGYRKWLAARLEETGVEVPCRRWNNHDWAVAVTHDVDFVGTRLRSRLKSLATGRIANAFSGFGESDPRRASLYSIHSAEQKRRVSATYFLKGGASTKHDVSYNLSRGWLQKHLEVLAEKGCEFGFHPSYAAYDSPKLFARELSTLTDSVGRPVQAVRTHFLRWTDPTTPRLIEKQGLRIDSSLGFADQVGFRRATSYPFKLFDIDANQPLDVWEIPLIAMDTTLFSKLGFSPEQATSCIKEIYDVTKRVGGCATVLWHNTLYDEKLFPRQAAAFEQSLDTAVEMGAFVGGLHEVLSAWTVNR